jgi:hypothetical protein
VSRSAFLPAGGQTHVSLKINKMKVFRGNGGRTTPKPSLRQPILNFKSLRPHIHRTPIITQRLLPSLQAPLQATRLASVSATIRHFYLGAGAQGGGE